MTIRCTGKIRDVVGTGTLEYRYEGDTIREPLEAFFEEYAVEALLIARTKDEAAAPGWAPAPKRLPGTWRATPEGEQTKPFARVLVNGIFNEHFEGLDTPLIDGDRVALM